MENPRPKPKADLSAAPVTNSELAEVDHSCPSFIKTVSKEQIQAVLQFLPIFENINPDDFVHMIPPPRVRGKVAVLGHLEYHPAVYEFVHACYENGFVQGFDWGAWAGEAKRYMAEPSDVASARLTTCIKLITTHLRAERFCDGHLQDVLCSGHITAILRRLHRFGD